MFYVQFENIKTNNQKIEFFRIYVIVLSLRQNVYFLNAQKLKCIYNRFVLSEKLRKPFLSSNNLNKQI